MLRVLVADDEPIERMVVSKKIQKYFGGRLETVLAENGEDAVSLFAEMQCRIAILDISMPGMNGLEAAEKIREKDKKCSIIFLTAFDEFSYAKRAISVKALDYLLKPGSDEELIAVLEEAINLAGQETAQKRAAKNIGETGTDGKRTELSGQEEKVYDSARTQAVADAIYHYIQEHYRDDISLQDVAGAMGYSDAYFCKIFKQCFDKNFTVFLTEFRVGMAKTLLGDAMVNIKDVCVQVGFRDSNYFARVFKRITGMTPSEYRNQMLRQNLALH